MFPLVLVVQGLDGPTGEKGSSGSPGSIGLPGATVGKDAPCAVKGQHLQYFCKFTFASSRRPVRVLKENPETEAGPMR